MIQIKLPCKAFVLTSYFTSINTSDLFSCLQEGEITSFDEQSKYVKWNINGVEQPIVHINSVMFKL